MNCISVLYDWLLSKITKNNLKFWYIYYLLEYFSVRNILGGSIVMLWIWTLYVYPITAWYWFPILFHNYHLYSFCFTFIIVIYAEQEHFQIYLLCTPIPYNTTNIIKSRTSSTCEFKQQNLFIKDNFNYRYTICKVKSTFKRKHDELLFILGYNVNNFVFTLQ